MGRWLAWRTNRSRAPECSDRAVTPAHLSHRPERTTQSVLLPAALANSRARNRCRPPPGELTGSRAVWPDFASERDATATRNQRNC
jgi:hypothetical protein